MVSFDLQRMLIGDFPFTFLLEVAVRVSAAFLAVFFFLKFSGRRGIRQLSGSNSWSFSPWAQLPAM